MTAPSVGRVTLDLQAAQSLHYRDRGIARYALDFAEAVVSERPDLVERVLVNPRLPGAGIEDRIGKAVPVVDRPDWDESGGVLHLLSPFELDLPLRELWPREISRLGMRLVVTLYDLIPDVFPDIYLRDHGVRRRYRARRELVRAADHVMTLSQSAADDAVRMLGMSEQRVSVVGASTSDIFQRPEDRRAAREEAFAMVDGLNGPFIAYNGAVEPRKNMEQLIEAYAALPADIRLRWQLVLVCGLTPSQRHHFEVRSSELGIGDRLVLTGFVPDRTLKLIYQAADLVVFPSLYEGFGLPVAEAIACGAPVIASGVSSLPELVAPEATFDPTDRASITACLARALTNDQMRDALLEWSARPQLGWRDVALRAAEVYEEVLGRPGSAADRWRRRPLVTIVTPWPPARTGVADYSERTVDALSATCDVDVVVDGDQRDDDTLTRSDASCRLPVEIVPTKQVSSLSSRDRALGGYDAVLVILGNSEFHASALRILRERKLRADVLLHDARLPDLYLHSVARDAVPEGLLSAIRGAYPELDLSDADDRDHRVLLEKSGVAMARDVVQNARYVFTTSDYAAGLVRSDCDASDASRIAVWPYAYPAAVERDPAGVEPGLVCSFGIVHEGKLPGTLIDALARLHRDGFSGRLAFVGPVSDELRRRLTSQAEAAGVVDRVILTGDVPDSEYAGWLRRAAVVVQLRARSNGETSGAVADALAHGIPTIVTNLGAQAGLPEFVIKVPFGVSGDDLALRLAELLGDAEMRTDLGKKSVAFVGEHGFDRAARKLFQLVPELRSYIEGR